MKKLLTIVKITNMPNWCWNTLEVQGAEKDMKEFYNMFKSNTKETFDFEWFAPMPTIFRDIKVGGVTIDGVQHTSWIEHDDGTKTGITDQQKQLMIDEYGADNWYDWSLENWGCKWNCSNVYVNEVNDNLFCCTFDTPWSPPYELFDKIHEMFPYLEINIEWHEEGGEAGDANWDEHFGFVSRKGMTEHITECCDVESEWNDDEAEMQCPKCKDLSPDTYTKINYDY